MSRDLAKPHFSVPPREYDYRYFHDVVRSFSVFIDQVQNPGEGRHTNIVLTSLPSSELGLAPGTLFHDAGALYIALSHYARPVGVSATGTTGSVTVTIT